MSRVVIVLGSDCALSADELVKAFSKYYPQQISVYDPGEFGEDTEKLRGSYPTVVATSRTDQAVARLRKGKEGHVCVGMAHGKMEFRHESLRADVAVIDIEGEETIVALCFFAKGEILTFFLESPREVYSAETKRFAETLARITAAVDSEGKTMMQ